mgnify:FL=1
MKSRFEDVRPFGLRVCAVFATGTLLATALAVPAFATVSNCQMAEPSVQTNSYEDFSVVRQGDCGDHMTYTLYDNGLLVFRGSGAMWDYDYEDTEQIEYMPWSYSCSGWYTEWSEAPKVKSVRFEGNITKIGSGAFKECSELTQAILPDSLQEIGRRAFYDCKKLTSVNLPAGLTKVGPEAFRNTGLTSLALPGGLKTIEDRAFSGCGITTLVIPEGVETIEEAAFEYDTKLTAVALPASLKSIDGRTFYHDNNLKTITVSGNNPTFSMAANSLYIGTEMVLGDPSATGVWEVPEGTTRIGKNAMAASEMEGVILPDTVTSVASGAFEWCNNLKGIYIPVSVTSMGGDIIPEEISGSPIRENKTGVFYAGSAAQWNSINGGVPPTLVNAMMQYNGRPEQVAALVQAYAVRDGKTASGYSSDPLSDAAVDATMKILDSALSTLLS